ncbi:MAG TPA: archease [Verrucomicrobia bacterium]|nr:archease [Verrucomicrobiota bacterium]
MNSRWELFQHQADIGVRGIGDTQDEAFANAAMAMTAVIADPKTVVPLHPFEVECEAPDTELLLVDWLNRIVFEMATRRMLFSRFDVCILPGRLRARIWGEAVDEERHQPAVEVKAATYHGLSVRQQEDRSWVAECVVDV